MGEPHCLLNEIKLFFQSVPLVIIVLILITLSVDRVSVWRKIEENWCCSCSFQSALSFCFAFHSVAKWFKCVFFASSFLEKQLRSTEQVGTSCLRWSLAGQDHSVEKGLYSVHGRQTDDWDQALFPFRPWKRECMKTLKIVPDLRFSTAHFCFLNFHF